MQKILHSWGDLFEKIKLCNVTFLAPVVYLKRLLNQVRATESERKEEEKTKEEKEEGKRGKEPSKDEERLKGQEDTDGKVTEVSSTSAANTSGEREAAEKMVPRGRNANREWTPSHKRSRSGSSSSRTPSLLGEEESQSDSEAESRPKKKRKRKIAPLSCQKKSSNETRRVGAKTNEHPSTSSNSSTSSESSAGSSCSTLPAPAQLIVPATSQRQNRLVPQVPLAVGTAGEILLVVRDIGEIAEAIAS